MKLKDGLEKAKHPSYGATKKPNARSFGTRMDKAKETVKHVGEKVKNAATKVGNKVSEKAEDAKEAAKQAK